MNNMVAYKIYEYWKYINTIHEKYMKNFYLLYCFPRSIVLLVRPWKDRLRVDSPQVLWPLKWNKNKIFISEKQVKIYINVKVDKVMLHYSVKSKELVAYTSKWNTRAFCSNLDHHFEIKSPYVTVDIMFVGL